MFNIIDTVDACYLQTSHSESVNFRIGRKGHRNRAAYLGKEYGVELIEIAVLVESFKITHKTALLIKDIKNTPTSRENWQG